MPPKYRQRLNLGKQRSKLGNKIKRPTKFGKKVATAALIGTIATTPYFVGKAAKSAVRSHSINRNLVLAKGNYLTEIKSVSERIGELNAKARREYSQKLQKSKNKDIKRKLHYLDEKQNKIIVVEMDAKKAMEIEKKQIANSKRIDGVVEKKVTELNKKARPEEVFFWNGKEITKINLGVAKLRNVYDKLYASEKAMLDSIYKEIIKDVKTNDKFSGEVAIKMGELNDTARVNYLASLSVEEFATRFGNNPKIIRGLNEVIKSLEIYKEDPKNPRNSREVLKFVQRESGIDGTINAVGAGSVTAIGLLSLWGQIKAYSRRKKK